MPIAKSVAIEQIGLVNTLELRDMLKPTEFLYGTEANKAFNAMLKADEVGERHWFKLAQGKEFTVPYSRSDAFRDAFAKQRNSNAPFIKNGFVCEAHAPRHVADSESIPYWTGHSATLWARTWLRV